MNTLPFAQALQVVLLLHPAAPAHIHEYIFPVSCTLIGVPVRQAVASGAAASTHPLLSPQLPFTIAVGEEGLVDEPAKEMLFPHFPPMLESSPHPAGTTVFPVSESTLEIVLFVASTGVFRYAFCTAEMIFVIPEAESSAGNEPEE